MAGGEVAGVGESAAAALRLGRRNRPREPLTAHFVEPPNARPLALPSLYLDLEDILTAWAEPIYLVGGAVRDVMLGRETKDLDFALSRNAVKAAFHVGDTLGVPAFVLDRARDTGRVVLSGGVTLDFARFRQADLEGDLSERDFTVNAIALPVGARTVASLIDPCGGLADLERALLRQTHPQSLSDDPVRALRAVRLAHELGFELDRETEDAVGAAARLLGDVSAERIRDELLKLLSLPDRARGIDLLEQLGLLTVVLPEVSALKGLSQPPPHRHDGYLHTLSLLRWLEAIGAWLRGGNQLPGSVLDGLDEHLGGHRQALLGHFERSDSGVADGWTLTLLGGLFHDSGKAITMETDQAGRIRFLGHEAEGARLVRHRLTELRLANAATAYVERIVAGHMRPLQLAHAGNVSRRAVYRYFRDLGPVGLDVALVALADHLGTYEGIGDQHQWHRLLQTASTLVDSYFDHHGSVISPEPLIAGDELMRVLGIGEGPLVGRLLRLISEAQAAGDVSTYEEALELARAALKK
jgi:poly(A) polymerase